MSAGQRYLPGEMLSRAASSLYRAGRNLERAESLARVLDVHLSLWLDRPGEFGSTFWSELVRNVGGECDDGLSRRGAIESLVAGADLSVRRAMEEARRGAQAVRPSLSTEVFEQLNALYWRLEEADTSRDLHGLLSTVHLGVPLVFGLIEDTMAHDTPYDFLRLGKCLERASSVTRLVTRKSTQLGERGNDPVEWAAVLKCCSGFEAYRWRFSTVTPEGVMGFLLLERDLPRSASYSIREALQSVTRIDGTGTRSRPHRLLGQLSGIFEYTDATELASDPGGFESAFRNIAVNVDQALQATYFQPSRIAEEGAPPLPIWAQSQQQQQQ